MSGELAIILWAARTPAGNTVPPSPTFPPPRVGVTATPPHPSWGACYPAPAPSFPRPHRSNRPPWALGPLPATGPTCCCEALGQGKSQLAGPDEAHAHGVAGAPTPSELALALPEQLREETGRIRSNRLAGQGQARPLHGRPAPLTPSALPLNSSPGCPTAPGRVTAPVSHLQECPRSTPERPRLGETGGGRRPIDGVGEPQGATDGSRRPPRGKTLWSWHPTARCRGTNTRVSAAWQHHPPAGAGPQPWPSHLAPAAPHPPRGIRAPPAPPPTLQPIHSAAAGAPANRKPRAAQRGVASSSLPGPRPRWPHRVSPPGVSSASRTADPETPAPTPRPGSTPPETPP